VSGENVYYEASGVAESGPTILFLHESGGCSATWHGQLVGLAQTARCLAVDLPGHARSEGIGYNSIAEYRRSVIGFLDALAIRWPVVLAGVCLGAAVAVDVALHAKGRVAGLVLAGVSATGRASEAMRTRAALGEAPVEFVEELFCGQVAPRLLGDRLQRWRLTSPVVRHGDLTAVTDYPMAASLRRVSHPMLVIAGERDPVVAPDQVRTLVSGMPTARVVEMPDAGCLSMVERPALFNQTVARFLAECSPESPVGPELRRPGGYRRH
jgi:pimeloyl-ACP methyl ester carboxylesterase